MGSDFYESDEQRASLLASGEVPVGIGSGCIITNAIIDKNARIGKVRLPAATATQIVSSCYEVGFRIQPR